MGLTPEAGAVTAALLAVARAAVDDRVLAKLICQAFVDGLDIDGAALSLLTAQVASQTMHATDPTAELLEELQFTLNEGACIEAATTGYPVLISDIRHSGEVARWPVFAASVIERSDVRALFALPLQWGTVNLGVIDLYRRVPGGLSDVQGRDALRAADTAALMMLTLRTDPDVLDGGPGSDGGWLDSSVATHAEIHQATGMVLIQLDIAADVALARIRARAFAEGRLLVEVARDVVARRLVFTREMT